MRVPPLRADQELTPQVLITQVGDPPRAAAVCLGLLIVLLLAGIIGLGLHHKNIISGFEDCKVRNINLAEKNDQLQISFNTLKKERDQLQTNFNKESDQLKPERDKLQKRFSDLKQAGPKGWMLFQSTWYYISSEVKSWDESRQDCRERGADLVIINSKEEQTFLTNLNKRVWIGLTDKDREGTWKWVDGTPLITAYWTGPQPDNGGGDPIYGEEDCAEIIIWWIWNDTSCANHYNWVCEKVKIVPSGLINIRNLK
uniref:C-type lectin domain-containing protein n=1 Tax=Hucho hucho TaxID=62062 RepID=A0A4W5Q9H7_9TELE